MILFYHELRAVSCAICVGNWCVFLMMLKGWEEDAGTGFALRAVNGDPFISSVELQ